MTETANVSRQQHRKPRPEKRQKRPQLTHFLCLPLVNTKSLPQLEESLAAFKTAHLAERGPATQSSSKEGTPSAWVFPAQPFVHWAQFTLLLE
ncbi:hypothetical protein N7530_004238 [Penicillium desertorum]|uniref:Uncharacterized protein n=1 Tax=Penicillium desertorum TaxID=1303715 RepID=A0A9X0BQ67_9EURO|nr:hypothetical protein N7530_004238 [Penicillium desertorum]